MPDITNADRAAWAANAIDTFAAECRMDGEDKQTKAKDLDFADYDFVYEQQEGDETAYIAAPDDEQADPVEVDLREEGEPFSWEAVNIVKDLASFYDRTFSSSDIVGLLGRAHRACTKITGGMEG